ncbi:hypothetical protein GALL_281090 [mine drainage metagenome]|uniref:Uncharacterized protein n=1 Tax=mine drainage metagenome TaxID=410659 RepID=A0A1J5RK97_9ZZZZ
MSTASKVTSSVASSVGAAVGNAGTGQRATSFDAVERITPPFLSVKDPWRHSYDEEASDGFGAIPRKKKQDPDNPQSQFTQLVKMAAASYPASESMQDFRSSAPILVADLMHGLGVYEINMKICSGMFRNQGSVINRFS